MSLEGKTILVTRPRGQSQEIQNLLESQGGTVVFQPVIEILPVEDDTAIQRHTQWMELFEMRQTEADQNWRFIQNSDGDCTYDWLLFSSANGVEYFMQYFDHNNPVYLGGKPIHLAAVGPGTAAALLRFGLEADIVPELHQAEGLIEALKNIAIRGKYFLLVRGSRGRDTLATELVRLGGRVDEIVVYRSVDVTQSDTGIRDMLHSGQIDVVTATSSSIAHSLIKLFGEGLRKSRIVTISPLTSQVFQDAGFPVAGQAESATIASLVECVASMF
ncbi:MAG: uroporphyrinogen-III synthase [Planctomycetia bacterium]|nr:uroporphyrinogen-III synthase [Planctomycetia bacterium]